MDDVHRSKKGRPTVIGSLLETHRTCGPTLLPGIPRGSGDDVNANITYG